MSLFDRFLASTLPFVPKAIVGRFASRYVAGETLEEALEVIRALNDEGAMATVDLLGEEVHEPEKAGESVEEYLKVLAALGERRLDGNISVKPTQLGLAIDEELCAANIERLVEAAAAAGNFVRIDMEDRTTTEATLRIYRRLFARHGHVGAVLQAYMRRTLGDIDQLPEEGANIRLCKGIYIEPRADAWKGFETVQANFLYALEKLLRRGIYVGIATHDETLACGTVAMLDRLQVPRERYEFQMLLGVDEELRRILIAGGHRLRVYVPYGRDWYKYSMRRLRENPEVAGHIFRALFQRKHSTGSTMAEPRSIEQP